MFLACLLADWLAKRGEDQPTRRPEDLKRRAARNFRRLRQIILENHDSTSLRSVFRLRLVPQSPLALASFVPSFDDFYECKVN